MPNTGSVLTCSKNCQPFIFITFLLRHNLHSMQFVLLKYIQFSGFNIFTFCNQHHHLILDHFYHSQKKTRTCQYLIPIPVPAPGNHYSTFSVYKFGQSGHHGMLQNLLLSFAQNIPLYKISCFSYSSISWAFGLPRLLANINYAALNICVQVFAWAYVFIAFGYT